MLKKSVHLSEMKEVVNFVHIINKYSYDCDLSCGSYFVDAKSLLGVTMFQGTSNVELLIHADNADDLLENIKFFSC